MQTATNNTIVSGNNIQAKTGLWLDSTSSNNKLNQNTLTNCTTPISNSGTGTIINPTSSPTYTLTLNNVFDGSAQGTYVYSNTTTVTLTGQCNVNGVNQTSPTLTMNQDYFVYALNSLVLTNVIPTPSGNIPTQLPIITAIFLATLSGLAMFAVVPIISVAGLIITVVLMTKNGEEIDPKIIVAGVVLVIAVNIFAVVGILIINGVNNAMPATQFLLWFANVI